MPKKTNGNHNPPIPPLKIDRSFTGVTHAYMEIAERVANMLLGTREAEAATKALNGISMITRTQLDAIRMFEKGSEPVRKQTARILELGDHVEPELAP